MSYLFGVNPPLHHRYDKDEGLEHVSNRYTFLKESIAEQVEVLQSSEKFLEKCKQYYLVDLPDWVILLAVYNCIYNWLLRDSGHDIEKVEDIAIVEKLKKLIPETLYPEEAFLGADFEGQIKMHPVIVLRTYGFEPRRPSYNIELVDKFLRIRMKHYQIDIPHAPMFGVPAGEWPI